jgi:hypothetical protein
MALTVRVTRDDGSVTFKGWYRATPDMVASPGFRAACREREAWTDAGRDAVVVDSTDTRAAAELKAWKSACRNGGRYFPAPVSA